MGPVPERRAIEHALAGLGLRQGHPLPGSLAPPLANALEHLVLPRMYANGMDTSGV